MAWLGRVLATVLLVAPLAGLAASPAGTWKVDPASIQAVADRMAGAMAARVTPEDLAAMRDAIDRMPAQIAELRASNPALAGQMEELMGRMAGMGDDPSAAIRQTMTGLLVENAADATLVFNDDGEVTIEDLAGDGSDALRWHWRMDDGAVELIGTDPDDPSAAYVLRGPLDGDRMILRLVVSDAMRAELADEPDFVEMMGELAYELVRQ